MEILNEKQKDVFDEYVKKGMKSIGLNLEMGFGKTLLSLAIGMYNKKATPGPILVVMSKTLLTNWKSEIEKFFGKNSEIRKKAGLKVLKYVVYHRSHMKNIETYELPKNENGETDVDVVLTTVDVIGNCYKKEEIEQKFITKREMETRFGLVEVDVFLRPRNPYTQSKLLFSERWSSLIIDEIQGYTSITSLRCRGLSAVCAENRIATSGTLFSEPKNERIMGYYMIMNDPDFPRCIIDVESYMKDRYRGYQHHMIIRKKETNTTYTTTTEIISHGLSKDEIIIYQTLKKTLKSMSNLQKKMRNTGRYDDARRFGSYILSCITYLRQSVICPLTPFSKIALMTSELTCKSELSKKFMKHIEEANLRNYLNNPDSCRSTRIGAIIETLNKHKNQSVVVFSSFRTSLNMIKYYAEKELDRGIYDLTCSMSSKKRKCELDNFEKSGNGILFLTYSIGAEGLNLQSSSVVLLCDLKWNCHTTSQAISRIARTGQKSENINVYYFTSDTGIENCVFEKHVDKKRVMEELLTGAPRQKVKAISVQKIMEILNVETNCEKLESLIV